MSDGMITLVSWQEVNGKKVNVVKRKVPEFMIDRILALSLPPGHFRDIEYQQADLQEYIKEQKNESLSGGQNNPTADRANDNNSGSSMEPVAQTGEVQKLGTGNRSAKVQRDKPSGKRQNNGKRTKKQA